MLCASSPRISSFTTELTLRVLRNEPCGWFLLDHRRMRNRAHETVWVTRAATVVRNFGCLEVDQAHILLNQLTRGGGTHSKAKLNDYRRTRWCECQSNQRDQGR